jgi:hypothetical protein
MPLSDHAVPSFVLLISCGVYIYILIFYLTVKDVFRQPPRENSIVATQLVLILINRVVRSSLFFLPFFFYNQLYLMAARRYWKISLGSQWLPLDTTTAECVHCLWLRGQSGFINSSTFRDSPAYVDFDYTMSIIYRDTVYAIAYC